MNRTRSGKPYCSSPLYLWCRNTGCDNIKTWHVSLALELEPFPRRMSRSLSLAIQTPTHIAQCDSRTSTARSPEALFYHLINGVTIAWAESTSYFLLRSVGKNRGHVGSVLNCHSRGKRSFYFYVLYFFILFLSD